MGTTRTRSSWDSGVKTLRIVAPAQMHQHRTHCITLCFRGFNLQVGHRTGMHSYHLWPQWSQKKQKTRLNSLPHVEMRVHHRSVTLQADGALEDGSRHPHHTNQQFEQDGSEGQMWLKYPASASLHVLGREGTEQMKRQDQTVGQLSHRQAQVMELWWQRPRCSFTNEPDHPEIDWEAHSKVYQQQGRGDGCSSVPSSMPSSQHQCGTIPWRVIELSVIVWNSGHCAIGSCKECTASDPWSSCHWMHFTHLFHTGLIGKIMLNMQIPSFE